MAVIKKTDTERGTLTQDFKPTGKRGPKAPVIKGLFRRSPSLAIEELATLIRGIRLDMGLSQKSFSKVVGVSSVHICKIEQGSLIPNAVTLGKILTAVDGVSFDLLFAEIARIYVRDLYECVKDSYDQFNQEKEDARKATKQQSAGHQGDVADNQPGAEFDAGEG